MNANAVYFAANIWYVIFANKQIHPTQVSVLETDRKRIGMTKTDLNGGERMAREPGFAFRPTGTFADKVLNLEMMLRVAYADGEVDEAEIAKISEFAGMIGISQDQLNQLNAEVVEEVSNWIHVCSKCGKDIPQNSSFCPSCGAPIGQNLTAERVDFDIPSSGYAIAFADSTSGDFSAALTMAKANPEYQTCMRGKKRWYMAAYTVGDPALLDLISIADRGLKSRDREVYVNGTICRWDEAVPRHLIECVAESRGTFNHQAYCFGKPGSYPSPTWNCWGCRQIGLNLTGYQREWLKVFGKWEKSTRPGCGYQWRFDRNTIWHTLKTNAQKLTLCPFFNAEFALEVFKYFPEVIWPETDPAWKLHKAWDEDESPNLLRLRVKNEFGEYEEMTFDGVEPIGTLFLESILSKMMPKSEVAQIV